MKNKITEEKYISVDSFV